MTGVIRKNKYIITSVLIIVEVLCLFLLFKTSSKNVTILDDVKLKNNSLNNNFFALMLEQSDGTYQESNSNSWPTDMRFNAILSGCIDAKGNKIDGVLNYNSDTNSIKVKVNGSAFCYLYFDFEQTLSAYLIDNVPSTDLWQSTLEGDGYRFVGTNPDNYICFGTTNLDKCLSKRDDYTYQYLYRIIGIFEDNEGKKYVKIIKNDALYGIWNNDFETGVEWNNSDLYNKLNGSAFLYYDLYMPNGWHNKIATWNYTATNTNTLQNSQINYNTMTAQQIYSHELNTSTNTLTGGTHSSISAKVGLMYVSDYMLSLGNDALNYTGSQNSEELKTGWMHILNNTLPSTTYSEWTISRYGDAGGYYASWYIGNNGDIRNEGTASSFSVRPVFYLEADELYNGGTGSIDDPIMLKEPILEDEIISIASSADLWDSTLEDDGYRFVGTNPDNYICFGTNNKSTCVNDTDKYMYRIIGIFEDDDGQQHVKLIKKEALNTAYAYSASSDAVAWNNSDLYNGINGSYFLTNTAYLYMQDTTWTNKIATWNYTMTNTKSVEGSGNGSVNYLSTTAKEVYLHELYRKTTSYISVGTHSEISGKISLMYASDYLLSLGSDILNYSSEQKYNTLKTGWMHLSNNDTSAPENYFEATMTAFGDDCYWTIYNEGVIIENSSNYAISVRPVFYLESNLKLAGGTGTIDDPYRIVT